MLSTFISRIIIVFTIFLTFSSDIIYPSGFGPLVTKIQNKKNTDKKNIWTLWYSSSTSKARWHWRFLDFLVRAGLQSRTLSTWCTVQVLVLQSRRTKDDSNAPFSVQTPKDIRLSNIHQTTNPLWCTTFVWEVLTVHGNELRLFWAKAFPLL